MAASLARRYYPARTGPLPRRPRASQSVRPPQGARAAAAARATSGSRPIALRRDWVLQWPLLARIAFARLFDRGWLRIAWLTRRWRGWFAWHVGRTSAALNRSIGALPWGFVRSRHSAHQIHSRSCVRSRPHHFARFHTNSSVTPAGLRGFVNFMSSAVIDVTIRRWVGAPTRFGNVLVSTFALIVLVLSSIVYVPV